MATESLHYSLKPKGVIGESDFPDISLNPAVEWKSFLRLMHLFTGSEMEIAMFHRHSANEREKSTDEPRHQIRVNGVLRDVTKIDPRTPLAPYLHFMLLLHGTKTMCFESSCGSCAVVLEYDDPVKPGKRIVKSVNSCLYPIGALLSLKNHQLLTIEALGSLKKGLHPIQKRLADYNGSQCGFCSPGFVMQMFG
ncbi:hypothetical protein chiPu_0018039 [Chiloscyllium punctatum]|uniref:[2Fe-2S]-binding domain-containing protein n=1 Tax=Chiloscyllium punctatum TaxID=137246 RepID=A0A401RKL2_CHIPU|nr:hypothetical protein [Chiloscyllium punctatum]